MTDRFASAQEFQAAIGRLYGPIAHGFLTLALAYHFLPQLIDAPGAKLCINYGCDRVRFPAVVRADSQVRARAEILGAGEVGGGAVQVKTRVTIEVQGSEKPVCVADTLSRYYF